ncbi:unnamed protein product, partial [Scytosiphon promiscuus]
DNEPVTVAGAKPAQRTGTDQACEGGVATELAAASARPLVAGQALREAANTHGAFDQGPAVAASSQDAKSPTREGTPSTDGVHEKENVAARPPPWSASPTRPPDVAAASADAT